MARHTITRMEHHKTYFVDSPRKGRRRDYEIVLLYREIFTNGARVRVKLSANSWSGPTLEECEIAMVRWIEQMEATEADFDLGTKSRGATP